MYYQFNDGPKPAHFGTRTDIPERKRKPQGDALAAWGVQGPTIPDVQPPRFTVNGNYLAAPGFELDLNQIPGLMYGAMTPDERAWYRSVMKANGWTTLPISPFGTYRGWSYDYSGDMPAYRALLREAREGGLEPLAMCLTDRPELWTLDEALRYIDETLPHYKDECAGFSLAWESADVAHIHMAPEQVILQKHIKDIIGPDYPLWVHLPPRWWSPSYTVESGKNEWDFWNESRGILHGLLFQIEPNDPEHKVNYYLHEMYPIYGVAGICGRLHDKLGYEIALFEFARNFPDWLRVKAEAERHVHASHLRGFC